MCLVLLGASADIWLVAPGSGVEAFWLCDVAVRGQQPSRAWLLGTVQSLPYPQQFGFSSGGAKEVQAGWW